jgi:hypothetical protein
MTSALIWAVAVSFLLGIGIVGAIAVAVGFWLADKIVKAMR